MALKEFCILLFCNQPRYDENGREQFSCGGYRAYPGQEQTFIKSFENGEFALTNNILEAKCFEDDDECDDCMMAMIKHGATNIPVWFYYYNPNDIAKKARQSQDDERRIRGREHGDFHILTYDDYKKMAMNRLLKKTPASLALHYPNIHWLDNDMLQPALMNTSVTEWKERHEIQTR